MILSLPEMWHWKPNVAAQMVILLSRSIFHRKITTKRKWKKLIRAQAFCTGSFKKWSIRLLVPFNWNILITHCKLHRLAKSIMRTGEILRFLHFQHFIGKISSEEFKSTTRGLFSRKRWPPLDSNFNNCHLL